MCVKWPAGLEVQELKVSSGPSNKIIVPLSGRFHYESFIITQIPRGHISLTSTTLEIVKYIEDAQWEES